MLTQQQDILRFWSKVDKRGPDDCWPWLAGCFSNGYGSFSFVHKGKKVSRRAHRIALSLHKGKMGRSLALHSCDNRPCCNPSHLWKGSTLENVADRDQKGRTARGERSGVAKLNRDQVLQIRSSTASQRLVAAEYGISKSQVGNIRRNEVWRHL